MSRMWPGWPQGHGLKPCTVLRNVPSGLVFLVNSRKIQTYPSILLWGLLFSLMHPTHSRVNGPVRPHSSCPTCGRCSTYTEARAGCLVRPLAVHVVSPMLLPSPWVCPGSLAVPRAATQQCFKNPFKSCR